MMRGCIANTWLYFIADLAPANPRYYHDFIFVHEAPCQVHDMHTVSNSSVFY